MPSNAPLVPPAPDPTAVPDLPRTVVLWCNLGSPDEPTAPAVRRYLSQFLHDYRVIEIPRAIWCLILHGIILRVRPAKSAAKYKSIWLPEGSPLKVWTEKQAKLLAGWLGERGHRLSVRHAMRYANPSIASQLDAAMAEALRHRQAPAFVKAVEQSEGAATVQPAEFGISHAMQQPDMRSQRLVGGL